MKVEIGGGTLYDAETWDNIDPVHGSRPELCRRIQDGVDLPDNSVECARASHVLEHIPAGVERINALNEVHRILVPGGEFETITPCVGYTDPETGAPVYNGWQAFADYTHLSFWWYPESWKYLVRGGMFAHAEYGLNLWDLGECELRDGWEAKVVLIKPMPEEPS